MYGLRSLRCAAACGGLSGLLRLTSLLSKETSAFLSLFNVA
jgi:hypothetical protein